MTMVMECAPLNMPKFISQSAMVIHSKSDLIFKFRTQAMSKFARHRHRKRFIQMRKTTKLEISHRLTLDLNCYNGFITSIVLFDCFVFFVRWSAIQKSYTRFQLFPFSLQNSSISIANHFVRIQIDKSQNNLRANIEYVVIANFFWPFMCVQLANLCALCHIKNTEQWD